MKNQVSIVCLIILSEHYLPFPEHFYSYALEYFLDGAGMQTLDPIT